MARKLSLAWRQMWTPPQRFESAALEQAFLRDYGQRFAGHRRVAVILGVLIGTLYLAADYLYSAGDPGFAPVFQQVVINRVSTSLLLAAFLLLFLRPRFEQDEHYATTTMIIAALLQFLLYCRGFLLVPFPYDYMYFFMGMFICMIFCFSMLRLRARPVVVLMVLCVVAAACTFLWSAHTRPGQAVSHPARIYLGVGLSFLVSVATMGCVVGILLERSERATFKRAAELATTSQSILQHSREVERLNMALQQSSQETQEKAQALIELKEHMRQEAERRNQEKSRFLAAAVHDLKQPVQAIGNALEPGRHALKRQDLAQASDMLDLAASAVHLMRGQLSAVLEISRVESGLVEAELSSFDIQHLITEVLSQLAALAARDGVRLLAPEDSTPFIVVSDRHFMGRILLNLVSNGIKYHDASKTNPPPWVRVSLHPEAQHLRLEVSDNGIGIEAAHLDSGAIFKPFFQANNHQRENEKGVGLGLSIVQAMLGLLPDHRMSVRSQLKAGTCMALELPWGNQIALAQPNTPADWAGGQEPLPTIDALRGIYLLYVEDDELVRNATCALLDAFGILYEVADSQEDLIALLPDMERLPDLLLTDYRLPHGVTARQIIETVTEAFGEVPALVISGEVAEPRDITRPYRLLRKPTSPSQLLHAIREATANRTTVHTSF